MDGAKLELQEVVDFLKNPDKYTALGAKIPKVRARGEGAHPVAAYAPTPRHCSTMHAHAVTAWCTGMARNDLALHIKRIDSYRASPPSPCMGCGMRQPSG